jgi:hypothetical protein
MGWIVLLRLSHAFATILGEADQSGAVGKPAHFISKNIALNVGSAKLRPS